MYLYMFFGLGFSLWEPRESRLVDSIGLPGGAAEATNLDPYEDFFYFFFFLVKSYVLWFKNTLNNLPRNNTLLKMSKDLDGIKHGTSICSNRLRWNQKNIHYALRTTDYHPISTSLIKNTNYIKQKKGSFLQKVNFYKSFYIYMKKSFNKNMFFFILN